MKAITLIAFTAGLAAAAPAFAEEAHRELGPHVHGHGTLNIAIEAKRVSIELEAPGMDIVGFEHDPNGAEQTAALEKAKAQLADPLSLFKVPASAACKLVEAKTTIEDHDHDHDHEDHAAEKADDPDEHGGHNAFHVTYALDCAVPENLTSITFDYFKAFAGAKELDVSLVTEKAQSKFEVTREKPVLDLAGAI